MTDWPNHLPRQIPCGHCGTEFNAVNVSQAKHFKYDGSVLYCSPICREAARQKKYSPTHTFGPCPKCGQMFESKVRKIFCSMKCYVTSDRFKEIISEKAKSQRGPRPELQKWDERDCLECAAMFRVKPAKPNKFCSQNCYHNYMAKVFDRHIAAPDRIEIGQGYDEYLSQNKLRCPIEGCDWSGQWLTLHVRMAHGITEQDFKKAAGFNLTEGIITPALRSLLENRKTTSGANRYQIYSRVDDDRSKSSGYVSLQSREARIKARALAMNIYGSEELPLVERTCDFCKKEFPQLTPFGRSKFCSIKCRSDHYHHKTSLRMVRNTPLYCTVCGSTFAPSAQKVHRHASGLPVTCSIRCRNSLNARKRRSPRPRTLR